VRELRYRTIADELRRQIEAGQIRPGGLLPSESDLSRTYAVSRVTVRKALELLRAEGVAAARQGFGWFAAMEPLRRTLGRLGTIEDDLAASGRRPERKVLDFGFVNAPTHVATVLGTTEVLQVRRLNLADGLPFARVTVWVPARLGSSLSRDDVERTTFYELLDVRLGGAEQTIRAAAAGKADAALLQIPVGSPVLVCDRITCTVEDQPVIAAEHVFPADRTEFVVELSTAPGASMAPSGLRLVDQSRLQGPPDRRSGGVRPPRPGEISSSGPPEAVGSAGC
jgi:GntR family transcriptional regulator